MRKNEKPNFAFGKAHSITENQTHTNKEMAMVSV